MFDSFKTFLRFSFIYRTMFPCHWQNYFLDSPFCLLYEWYFTYGKDQLGEILFTCLVSQSRIYRYQETVESKEKLKYNCTEGLAQIPLNYAVEWVHLHSRISTIHVWAVSSYPRGILTHTSRHPRCFSANEDIESNRILPPSLIPHNSLLILIISPPELPVPYWSGLLSMTPTACGLVSIQQEN